MKLKTKEQLPFKYFLVKNDDSAEFKDYLSWLNEQYGYNWDGYDRNYYYGYDGNSSYYGTNVWLHINDFENNPKVFTAKEFMDILKKEKMSDKKIIGYKAPCNINSEIRKGDIMVLPSGNVTTYVLEDKHLQGPAYALSKELVETWEPVYENTEIIVSMGGFNLKVTPEGIFHKSENIITFVSSLVGCLSNNTISRHANYSVIRKDIIFSQTGCEHSETKLSQWKEVWNTYQKLKN